MPAPNINFSTTYLDKLPTGRREIYEAIIESVSGSTPLQELENLEIQNDNRVFLKLEYHNLGGVHHSRIYPYVFARAEALGFIVPGVTPVIETSAGGAAIAFSHCANVLGFSSPHPPQVIVPDYASKTRLQKLEALNAKIHRVPPGEGGDSTVHYLEKILAKDKAEKGGEIGKNPHRLFCCTKTQKGTEYGYHSLADECCDQLHEWIPGEHFNFFFGCIGSGSSISGVGRRLKTRNPGIRILATEHENTPIAKSLLEGKRLVFEQYPHPFHGAAHWGVALEKLNVDYQVIDNFESFNTESAMEVQRQVEDCENLRIGLTSSAALSIALRTATQVTGKKLLVIAYDTLEQSRIDEPS